MAVTNTNSLAQPDVWFKRRWVWVLFGLFAIAAMWSGQHIFKKEKTMPPPLVFLIPADYFGPVFFFFGQPDGVDVQPDPLGQSVMIPSNGVVKIKANVEAVMGQSREGYRATWMVSISPSSARKVINIYVGGDRNEDGIFYESYFDDKTQLHKYPAAIPAGKPPFYFLTEQAKNEPMVFAHGGCSHQDFYPVGDVKAKAPACGKFLLLSPNQYIKKPDFLWEEFAHRFSSIDALVKQANEALAEKKAFYKLS